MAYAGRVLVVVPTYNEAENLPTLATSILAQGAEIDLLVVDDASPDGTGDIADALAASEPRITVVHRARKAGLGPAYIEGLTRGLANAAYDRFVTMDGDLSHDPADLARLLAATDEPGADIAVGSRWTAGGGTRGWPRSRRVLSRGGSLYARTLLGLTLRDVTGGYRCMRRSALAQLDIESVRCSGYAFLIELNYRAALCGLSVVEVPIVFTERAFGVSKMSGRIVAEAVLRVPSLRFTAPRALSRARAAG